MGSENTRRVLDVGQCDPDHASIVRLLKQNFDVTVDRAKSSEQVQYMMGFYDYDLVLVNRVFDADGDEGLALIEALRQNADTRDQAVMLVSNHADAQRAAVELGAWPGFGKAELDDMDTLARLRAALGA